MSRGKFGAFEGLGKLTAKLLWGLCLFGRRV